MHKKHLIVLAAVVTAAVAGTALAKGPAGQHLTPVVPVTVACPTYVLPSDTTFQNDWNVVSPQGWLDHGAIEQGTLFVCYYGIDRAAPAQRPAFFLRRPIPAAYRSCGIDANRTSMTCQMDAPPTP